MRILFVVLIMLLGFSSVGYATSIPSMRMAEQELDEYYAELFLFMGHAYHSPTLEIVEPGLSDFDTPCGTAPGKNFYAMYCLYNETIYMEQLQIDRWGGLDEFIPMFVLAHEWAHHAQYLVGMDRITLADEGDFNDIYTIEFELMADCLAGAWSLHLDSLDLLDSSDMANVLMVIADEAGDGGFWPRTSVQAHGWAEERVAAVLMGYEGGLLGCMTLHPLPRGDDGVTMRRYGPN